MPEQAEKDTKFSTNKQPSDGVRKEGRNKRRIMTDALMIALNREVDDCDGKPTKQIAKIAKKLVENAADGDMQAIKEVFDRTEGKAAQAIQLTGEDGGPVRTDNKWTVEFVNATPESK